MKKIILISAALALFASCSQEPKNGYTVNVQFNGDLTKIVNDTIIMSNFSNTAEDLISDTVVMNNNKVTFTGNIDTPQYIVVLYKNSQRPITRFFIENSTFDINVNLGEKEEVVISGGNTQNFIDSLSRMQEKIYKEIKLDSLMKTYGTATEEGKKYIENMYDAFKEKVDKIKNDFISANPTSFFALNTLLENVESEPIDSVEAKLAKFKAIPEYAKNKNINKIENIISTLKTLAPGSIAPDFTQNDPEGNPVTFSNVYKQNKVTMVDFWASWCGPCRAFNPTLVEIYEKYKNKGFGIIGVSLDREKEPWIKAIDNDKLTWVHVSDLGYWDNAVAKQYYVRFVPQNIFVDSEGKIIKRHASEDEIITLLEENLNK
jgi:Thiol-disulfide isomerase and thioredoxins